MQNLLPFRWAALALVLLLAWDASGLDLWIVRHIGDASGFALKESWFTEGLLHKGGQRLAMVVMACIVAVNLWPRFLPLLTRRERVWWLAVTAFCLALIPIIKSFTLTSCPWDLAEFGGRARYVSHWAFGVVDGGGGRCFPSGHASAAFSYLAGGWALARAYPRAAHAWLVTTVALGVVFGVSQMVRGAHYPSHTMWTGWICWAVTVAAAHAGPWRLSRGAA